MTDEDVVRKLASITGVGNVYECMPQKGHHQISWSWSCQRCDDVLDLFQMIHPLMGQRRQEKITWLIHRYMDRPIKGGRYDR